MTANTRYIIFSEKLGVYIGSCMGMGFWSKLDPVDQTDAVTFCSESDAKSYMDTWESEAVTDAEIRPVTGEFTSDGVATWISEQQIVANGMPGWSD